MSKAEAVFVGSDSSGEEAVWVTDGTSAGTTELVRGVSLHARDFTVSGNKVLFVADDELGTPPSVANLWITDGTVAGTSDLVPDSGANDLTPFGSEALFISPKGALWVTDGTTAGTSELTALPSPSDLTVFGSKIAFASSVTDLFVTDGTAVGTSNLTPHSSFPTFGFDPSDLTPVGDKLFFRGNDTKLPFPSSLWVTDGTATGTSELAAAGASTSGLSPTDITAFGTGVLFAGIAAPTQSALFISDGTSAGTFELKPAEMPVGGLFNSTNPEITVLGSKALFIGNNPSNVGTGVWVTDGTAAGTSDLSISGAGALGINPMDLTLFGDRVLFGGTGVNGKQGLWITDGTAAGTTEVLTPPLTSPGLNISGLTASDGKAFFLSDGLTDDQEGVWVTDGTSAGTSEIAIPGTISVGFTPVDLTAFTMPCFQLGTRIATPAGETAVQDLRPGDLVLTADGNPARIRWIGERRLDLTRHPDPRAARPIRICRDALADDMPRRDLLVSPDHAMFLHGLLIPARLLLNDATILRETRLTAVHYFHVELDSHAILLAEGALAESYLDTGNRAMFQNAGLPLLLHPDFSAGDAQRQREQNSCAPFAADAARVQPVWMRLAHRACMLGHALPEPDRTGDPDLRILLEGREVRPLAAHGDRYVFVLPHACGEMRLLSRATAPCDVEPWVEDRRALGVMVRRITLRAGDDLRTIAPDDPILSDGWWAAEGDRSALWRWTTGNARLPRVTSAEAAVLEVHCIPTTYLTEMSADVPLIGARRAA